MLSLVVSLPQFNLPSWDYRLAIIGPLHLDIHLDLLNFASEDIFCRIWNLVGFDMFCLVFYLSGEQHSKYI